MKTKIVYRIEHFDGSGPYKKLHKLKTLKNIKKSKDAPFFGCLSLKQIKFWTGIDDWPVKEDKNLEDKLFLSIYKVPKNKIDLPTPTKKMDLRFNHPSDCYNNNEIIFDLSSSERIARIKYKEALILIDKILAA